jgi:dolichol-phosphate mannosyltransferase
MKQAVVIIPTYNERGNIEKTIAALLAVFKTITDWKMDVLVVDDTSPDKTYELVGEISQKHKQVHLYINKKKAGLGGAYLKGMEYAFSKLNADVVFEFDADLSHDPSKIPLFLKSMDAGSDMVLGSRYVPGGSIPQNWGLHRKILSVTANLIIMVVFTNFSIRDWTSGYRAITKKVYTAVHPLVQSDQFSGYAFQIGFLYHALRKGFKIDPNIPYHFVDREIGESKVGPEYIKNTLFFIFKMRLKEILQTKLFKFAFTGGIGALVQLTSLQIWWSMFAFSASRYEVANFLSIETAIFSNFLINNGWTFADTKIERADAPKKFLQFNLASAGSIIIQMLIAFSGKRLIGLFDMFTIPLVHLTINTGMIFAVIGILVGMTWNFFAYTHFIWKK